MEASVVERLRRSGRVRLHETLVNAPLIYDENSKKVMGAIYKEYMRLALDAHLPMLVCTPTWRANRARVLASSIPHSINTDAVAYMRELRDSADDGRDMIKIGGMIGCKNDCYLPDEGLSVSEAKRFHTWQIEQLAAADVDFLLAETLPNTREALGIAKAMALTGIQYIISFVISRDGRVLDGIRLLEAIELIDAGTDIPPIGYMVNCAHPSFLHPEEQSVTVLSRLIGYQANASSLDHCDLDKADDLQMDSVSEWGRLMLALNDTYGIQILGGCCGTGVEHLQCLIEKRKG